VKRIDKYSRQWLNEILADLERVPADVDAKLAEYKGGDDLGGIIGGHAAALGMLQGRCECLVAKLRAVLA
jgi:hypothetical protein